MYHFDKSKGEFVRQRRLLLAELIGTTLRDGTLDPENGLQIGSNEWFAKKVLEKMGDLHDAKGRPVLPKAYYMGGAIAAQAVATDYFILRQMTKTEISKNLESIRNYKTHELEVLANKLYNEILASGAAKSLGQIEQLLKINEQIFKLNGLNAPAKQINANLNIDMGKLTRKQLDRLASGEPLEEVLADQGVDVEETEEEDIYDAEFTDAEED